MIKFEDVFDRFIKLDINKRQVESVKKCWQYMSESEILKEILHFKSIMNVIKFTNPSNDS